MREKLGTYTVVVYTFIIACRTDVYYAYTIGLFLMTKIEEWCKRDLVFYQLHVHKRYYNLLLWYQLSTIKLLVRAWCHLQATIALVFESV